MADIFDAITDEPEGDIFDQISAIPNPNLSAVRRRYVDELNDPEIVSRLYSLTHREVGGQGPEAQRAFMETVLNRAAARKKSLTETVNDPNYYPRQSLRPAGLGSEDVGRYGQLAADVLGGSNVSNYATGNASGNVGFAGGPQTFKAGGERFGIEGPDRNWAEEVQHFTSNAPLIAGTPTAASVQAAQGDIFDQVAAEEAEPTPTQTPTPTPEGGGSFLERMRAMFTPSPEEAGYMPQGLTPAEEQEAVLKVGREHPYLKNFVEATGELVAEQIPRTPQQYLSQIYPPAAAFEQAKAVSSGHLEAIPGVGTGMAIHEAGETPAFSKERFKAAERTLMDLGMLAGAGAGRVRPRTAAEPMPPLPEAIARQSEAQMRAAVKGVPEEVISEPARPAPAVEPTTGGEPYASEVTSAEGVSRPQVRPEVDEGAPLRQLGEAPAIQEEVPGRGPTPEAQAAVTPEPYTREAAEARATGIKNVVTEAEREARGIVPAEQAAARDFGTVWDDAATVAQKDPEIGRRLVDELQEKPRPLSDTEDALLLRRQIEVQNEHDAAIRAVNESPGDPLAEARLASARDQAQKVYDAGKSAGTETGRGLNARKMLAANDFSLVKMEAETRAVANGGRPLSKPQLDEVKALHERIATAEAKVAGFEAKEAFEAALKEAKAASKTQGFKVQDFLDQQAVAARERIVARRGKLYADPIGVTQVAHLADEAIIGASHIVRGVTKFADWSAAMIREFGENIKPFLKDLYKRAQAIASEGGKVAKTGANELVRRYEQLELQIAKLKGLAPKKEPAAPREQISDHDIQVLQTELNRIKTVDKQRAKQMAITERLERQVARAKGLAPKVEKQPKPRVEDIETEALQTELNKVREIAKEEWKKGAMKRALAGDVKRIGTRTEQLKEKLRKGEFEKPARKPPRMSPEKTTAMFQYAKAKEAYHHALIKAQRAARPMWRKAVGGAEEAVATARAVKTAYDLSAVLRQGGAQVMAHPIRARNAFARMIESLKSDEGMFRINEEIKSRPNAQNGKYAQYKLFLADPEVGASLGKMEEVYSSRLAKHIPGVRMSERGYVTFLNVMRADSMDALINAFETPNRKLTLEEGRALANYVNIATGRGNLGKLGAAARPLSLGLFAPRYMLSRLQYLVGQPMWGGSMRTRMLIAREYGQTAMGVGLVIALGLGAGATMETDSKSTDFGKLKFGNTRIDPWFGLQQHMVYLSRLWTGKRKTAEGKIVAVRGPKAKYGEADITGRFLRSKAAPVPGTIMDLYYGKDYVGNEVTPLSAARNLVSPLSMEDIFKVMVEQGVPVGTAMSLLSFFGMGVSTYAPRKKKFKASPVKNPYPEGTGRVSP